MNAFWLFNLCFFLCALRAIPIVGFEKWRIHVFSCYISRKVIFVAVVHVFLFLLLIKKKEGKKKKKDSERDLQRMRRGPAIYLQTIFRRHRDYAETN